LLASIKWDFLQEENLPLQVEPEKCLVIAHVHLLPSVIPLFFRLQSLGFLPWNIIIIPKPYSTITYVSSALKQHKFDIREPEELNFKPGQYDTLSRRALAAACEYAAMRCQEQNVRRCILVDDGGMLTDAWWRKRTHLEGVDVISV